MLDPVAVEPPIIGPSNNEPPPPPPAIKDPPIKDSPIKNLIKEPHSDRESSKEGAASLQRTLQEEGSLPAYVEWPHCRQLSLLGLY